MANKIKNINVSVTDLSAICGMDHYDNFSKVICKIWKQLDKPGFEKLEVECRKRGRSLGNDGFIKKIKSLEQSNNLQNNQIASKVYAINQKRYMSSRALVNEQKKVLKEIDDLQVSQQDKDQFKKLVQSASNTVFGSRNESGGVDIFVKETGKEIESKQTKLVHPFHTDNARGYQWNLIGKTDGLTTDGEILEIKNRQKELFNTVRDYEMCQVQCYLHMSKRDKAFLVEVLKRRGGHNSDFNIIPIEKDPHYYQDNVGIYLDRFVGFMSNLVWGQEVEDTLRLAVIGGDRDGVGKGIYYG
jgi:hypothetical protein